MIRAARTVPVVVALVLACLPAVGWGQESEQSNQGVHSNAKGPAVAGRAPGLWVRAALNGPEITQTQEQAETPTRLQNVYIDLINAIFTGLNQIIPLLSSAFDPSGGGGGIGDLVITELANDGTNSFVEVYNPSGIRIELDNWAFCQADGCTGVNELQGLVMEPDDILVFQLGGQPDADDTFVNDVVTLRVGEDLDDLAVYDFTGTDSRDPEVETSAMRGYILWGEEVFQSFGLESVAVGRGLWTSTTNIESSLNSQSFQLNSDNVNLGGRADDFIVVQFESNSLGELTDPGLEENTTTPTDEGDVTP